MILSLRFAIQAALLLSVAVTTNGEATATTTTPEAPPLRSGSSPIQATGLQLAESNVRCEYEPGLECPSCSQDVLDRDAGGHSCRARIAWVVETQNQSMRDACAKVAGHGAFRTTEFPRECGGCNPHTCLASAATPLSASGAATTSKVAFFAMGLVAFFALCLVLITIS